MSYFFCPSCGNLLLTDTTSHKTRLKCRACEYLLDFVGTKKQSVPVYPLEVNYIASEENSLDFVNKTEAKCENCGHNEAYYQELQIRSADEPATLFFMCVKCKHQWREG